MSRIILKSTCPRDCYDGCGMRIVVEDGVISSVLGDPEHPLTKGKLCGKCALAYNGAWRDPTARLLHPLRRSGPKGSGEFERVSWEVALADIAARLHGIIDEHGAQRILYTHYTGTLSMLAFLFPSRFFHRLGATEVDPDTICNKAGQVALQYTLGSATNGFDPATIVDSRCVLVWGANPSATAPHVDANWLRRDGITVICIDPVAHPTAQRARMHLQLRPGSDGALAFGLLHVLHEEGLLDEAFLASSVQGWDELLPAVLRATPARTEALTGIAEGALRAVARTYAAGPSLLWLGQGLQRQPMGGNALRAAVALCAATGNIGRPGAGLLYFNGMGSRGLDAGYVVASHLAFGEGSVPPPISHLDLAAALADPAQSRALITFNNNVAASNPDQRRLREALKREDLFQVTVELFATDTADFADYVLPAASFLEFDDLVSPYFQRVVIAAQRKATEPLGEALPNQEIFRRLAGAMGFAEPELFERDEVMLARLMEGTGTGLSFEELAEKGQVRTIAEPVVAFEKLRFRTPSGRIELASGAAEAAGLPRVPLPHAEDGPAGMLRVLSPASEWNLNSSYANDSRVAHRQGQLTATMHPSAAQAAGVAAGDVARLVNDTGALDVVVLLSKDVLPGVVLVPKGRWLKTTPGGANVNVLNPGHRTDMGDSSAVHGVYAWLVSP